MDFRLYALCFATFVLVATSFAYGWKFLRKRNYLLGVEWLVITFSASNFLLYMLSGSPAAYGISYFCDAFSRGFGIPVIAIAGLMVVTHRYRPSIFADVWFFVVGIAAGAVLVATDSALKPYFYVVMWAMFSVYLGYFAWRLMSVGEKRRAMGVILALLSSLAIACIYDFYKIPGEDTNILINFYVLAALTWSYVLFELYYAYCALERADEDATPLKTSRSASRHARSPEPARGA
jgi:hypothetical protein